MRISHRLILLVSLLGLFAHAAVARARPKNVRRQVTDASAQGSGPEGTEPGAPAEAPPGAAAHPAAATDVPEEVSPPRVTADTTVPGTASVNPAAAAPVASQTASAAANAQNVAALRGEVSTLMDDLVSARAKAAILGKVLFKTRIVVRVQNLAGPDPVLTSVVLKLDGAPVFRGEGGALHDDEAHKVFESFVAPGPHVLSVEVEQRARDDAAYGYTLRESYRITAPREKETELTVVLDDDSTLAEDFPDDGEGEYDVRTRLRQKTRESHAR